MVCATATSNFWMANNESVTPITGPNSVPKTKNGKLFFSLAKIGLLFDFNFPNAIETTTLHTPSLLLTGGLERRVTKSLSFAGDLGYHYSLKDDGSGKNAFEFVLRMNCHL